MEVIFDLMDENNQMIAREATYVVSNLVTTVVTDRYLILVTATSFDNRLIKLLINLLKIHDQKL